MYLYASDLYALISNFSLIIAQPPIFKPKIALFPLTPAILPVEIVVSTLFIVLCDSLGIMSAFEPCQVLLVESPIVLF